MVVPKGYLEPPTDLWWKLEFNFEKQFFPEGVPKSRFYNVISRSIISHEDRLTERGREALWRQKATHKNDIHKLMNLTMNKTFNKKSNRLMYYDADWIPERVPLSEVNNPSWLSLVHLSQTKRIIDPTTGDEALEETELVRRIRASDMSEAHLMDIASIIRREQPHPPDTATPDTSVTTAAGEEYDKYIRHLGLAFNPYVHNRAMEGAGVNLLKVFRLDMFADMCGHRPVSSLNYPYITWLMLMLLKRVEFRIRDERHPLYVEFFEQGTGSPRRRRQKMILIAMHEEDPRFMEICAETLQVPNLTLCSRIIWDKPVVLMDELEEAENDAGTDECSVM